MGSLAVGCFGGWWMVFTAERAKSAEGAGKALSRFLAKMVHSLREVFHYNRQVAFAGYGIFYVGNTLAVIHVSKREIVPRSLS